MPADVAFLFDPPAAMVDEAGVMVADDPDPVEPRGQRDEQVAGSGGQAVAAEPVVEAVAQAVEPR